MGASWTRVLPLLSLASFAGSGCSGATRADDDAGASRAVRVPAEWEPHAATWMQWPGAWEAELRPDFASIVEVVAAYEPVHMLVESEPAREEAMRLLSDRGIAAADLTWHVVPIDNAWMRDNGPLYVTDGSSTWVEDFRFDAWGGNFGQDVPYEHDDVIPEYVAGRLGVDRRVHPGYVLERGNVEVNGAGTLVIGWDCQDDRNPGMTVAEHEAVLSEALGVDRIIWAYGHDPGDATTGHIDGYARFLDADTIAIGSSPWGAQTEEALATACEEAGLEVVRIPASQDSDYMNWLVGNGFVAAMAFGEPAMDAAARDLLQEHFPGREVHVIRVDAIWAGGGGVHCVTNDQPVLP